MKFKIWGIAALILMLGAVLFAENYKPPSNRYHQHREAPAKPACTDHGPEVFCTHLPLIEITTDAPMPNSYLLDENGQIIEEENGRRMHNQETVSATFKLFDSEKTNNHLSDTPVVTERSLIRTRGNSSRRFAKKNYLLKFKEENLVDNKDVSLCGMTADSTWVLHGPFMDRSLVRSYVCYNITGELMDYTPNVRFCELFINKEYLGLYLLVEKINYNPNGRVNLTPTDPTLPYTSYILRLDDGGADEMHQIKTFGDYSGKRGMQDRLYEHFEILYPGASLTQDQKDTITYEISALEKAMASFDSHDEKKGYPAYLDVDSFVNFLIINEFSQNSDAGILSTYFSKDVRGKIKIICWDFNNAFNNYHVDLSSPHGIYSSNMWYKYLLRSTSFVDQVVHRYHALRKGILSDEYLCNYIDETLEYLGPAIERNNTKWGYVFHPETLGTTAFSHAGCLRPMERNAHSYEEAITQLKSNIKEHGAFLDEKIEVLYGRCHDSVNKQFKYEGDD